MAATQSRTQCELQARLEKLPQNSPRRMALAAACSFKSSWVELGEALVVVRDGGHYKGWGYGLFEDYCKKELHIKGDTVSKLTRSFSYLKQHAPKRLEASLGGAAAPTLDVVDLLSQAAARTKVSEEALHRMGQELLQDDANPTRAHVLKKLREDDPEAFRARGKAAAVAPRTGHTVDVRKALLLAERLLTVLGEQNDVVTAASHHKLVALVEELRALHKDVQGVARQQSNSNLVLQGELH